MNHISQQQNTSEYIDLLCAQREAYTKAKKVFITRLALSLGFAILGPILVLNFETVTTYVAVIAIFYTLVDILFLRRLENNYREDGAKLQELFDVGLFGLDWNTFAAGDRPDAENVFLYSERYKAKNNLENLYNWYSPEIEPLNSSDATIICQRTNVWWDITLREKLFWILIAGMLGVTVLIFTLFSKNSTILFSILAACLPLYETLGDYSKSQWVSISKIKDLKSKMEEVIENISRNRYIVSKNELRAIQDEIFKHRSSCLFIPDWFYLLFRDNQESQMNYSATTYVNRINRAKEL